MSSPTARIRAYLRSPKGMLLLALLALTAIAWPVDGTAALVHVGVAIAAASITEMLFVWNRRQVVEFPDSAVLTGFIVALVLSQAAPLYVPIVAAGLAIGSKHLLRAPRGHIFNPATVGLLIASVLLSSEQSWWGGLGDLPAPLIVVVILAGVLIADRVNKFPAILTFVAAYFLLFTAAAVSGGATGVTDVFREPFTGSALFFAFFMMTDPPTTPARPRDQIWFGIIVAVASFLCYVLTGGAVYYLLVGLLAGNGYEALRRFAGIKASRRESPRAGARTMSFQRDARLN